MNKKLAHNLGLSAARQKGGIAEVLKRFDELRADMIKARAATLNNYDPATVSYRTSDNKVLTGAAQLKQFVDDPANIGKKVFANMQKKFDLALEGGGAFGFTHMGVAHGFAIKGIGFDRIAGSSAGAIAGALLAGGYEIDLNFILNVKTKPTEALTPSPNNSANQILFEDFFEPFTDMVTDKHDVSIQVSQSWFIKMVKDAFGNFVNDKITSKANALILDISIIERNISDAIINTIAAIPLIGNPVLDFRAPNLPFTPQNPTTRTIIRNSIDGLGDIFQNPTGAVSDFLRDIISKIRDLVDGVLVTATVEWIYADNELHFDRLGLFRLSEFGGFWDGNFVRNWIEKHLQAKVVGTGPLLDGSSNRPMIPDGNRFKRAVTFKDLPIDFCVTTADVGKVGDEFDARKAHLVFFSKKTSPDYPVAEAVRRSMSLPFVFVPRNIDEGYTDGAKVQKTKDYDDEISATSFSQIPNFPGSILRPFPIPSFHPQIGNVAGDHMCLDGGFFVNNPVSVFRDKDNEIFTCPQDSNGAFTKMLVISNLNSTVDTSQRPFDIPVPINPEPLKSIIKTGTEIIKGIMPSGSSTPSHISKGFDKLGLATGATLNSGPTGDWKEFEINFLLQVVPNSIYVESHLLDPLHKDIRLSSGEFAMPKTTKKWLVKAGFDATRRALFETENDIPALSGKLTIDSSIDPYLHLVTISNVNLTAGAFSIIPLNPSDASLILNPQTHTPAKFGDSIYIDVPITVTNATTNSSLSSPLILPFFRFFKPHSVDGVQTYEGLGYSWLKINNTRNNKENNSASMLNFDVNINIEVTLLLDIKPGFANTQGWIEESFVLMLSNGTAMKAFSKRFNKGNIVIPGPRNVSNPNNTCAYGIMVRPI